MKSGIARGGCEGRTRFFGSVCKVQTTRVEDTMELWRFKGGRNGLIRSFFSSAFLTVALDEFLIFVDCISGDALGIYDRDDNDV